MWELWAASAKGPYGVGSRKGLNLTRELRAGGGREAKGLAGMGVSNPSPTSLLCKPEDATRQLFHGALHLEPRAALLLSVWGPALWCMRTSPSLRETLTQHNHKKGPRIIPHRDCGRGQVPPAPADSPPAGASGRLPCAPVCGCHSC